MIDPALSRHRRRTRLVVWALVALIAATALADRAGLFGYRGDDWKRFHQRGARLAEIRDGEAFVAHTVEGISTEVRLLGIDAPDVPGSHWFDGAANYLRARLKDRTFTLRLDGTQTRDEAGRLLAYVYITDNDCLNIDCVRDGQAFADRRVKHSLKSVIEQAEVDPRKKSRGLWKDLPDDIQPAWRRAWLKSRGLYAQP